MPTAIAARPTFVDKLLGLGVTDEARKKILAQTRPEYAAQKKSWVVLLDAFEGTGGFLDGSYIWPYPREDQPQYVERQAMARYHNYLEALVDLYVRFMFTEGVRRNSKSQEFNEWLTDVDGAGTGIDEYLKKFASVSLVNGHAGTLVDKTSDEPAGPTRAEEQARPVLRLFTAPTIPDWRFRGPVLSAIKLFECAPEGGIADEMAEEQVQYLLWDEEGWARFDAQGNLIAADVPDLGLVPFVVLRPKPRTTNPMLGRALVSNANVVRALFNRASEQDEVLRSQAFSLLTVSVGDNGNVDEARTSIGNVVGAAKAIVVKGEIDYKTPSMEVPQTIGDNITYLVQEMYRAAHVRFKRDSLAAESGESVRLQYTELNEMLQGFAKSLAQAELQIARAWFAWNTVSPEQAQKAFESAKVEAQYPEEFFLDSLMTELEAWAEAISMNLGPTMTKRIKKKAVRRIDQNIPADELETIDKEIDGQKDDELLNKPTALDVGIVNPEDGGAMPGERPTVMPPQEPDDEE